MSLSAIRQQLINTEDIRRIRKKAPCTRAEIWMILSCSEELEIFEESIFTGDFICSTFSAVCSLHIMSDAQALIYQYLLVIIN